MSRTELVRHQVRPHTTALLLLDLTRAFVDPGAPLEQPAARAMVPRLRHLVETCRAAGGLVAFCGYVHREGVMAGMSDFFPELREGVLDPRSSGVEFVDDLHPQDGDVVIEKNTFGAFFMTSLEAELRDRGIDTVIIGGCSTNHSCFLTAREAQCRNFKVVFLSDGTATPNLPDAGFGPVASADLQRAFLTTIAFGVGQVMSVEEAHEALVKS